MKTLRFVIFGIPWIVVMIVACPVACLWVLLNWLDEFMWATATSLKEAWRK